MMIIIVILPIYDLSQIYLWYDYDVVKLCLYILIII
jgi:hypothetical protein